MRAPNSSGDSNHGEQLPSGHIPPFYRELSPEVVASAPQTPPPFKRRSGKAPVLLALLTTLIIGGPLAGLIGFNLAKQDIESVVRDYFYAYAARDKAAATELTCDVQYYRVTGWETYKNDPVYHWFNSPAVAEGPDTSTEEYDPSAVGIDEDALRQGVEIDIIGSPSVRIRSTSIGPIGHARSIVSVGDGSVPQEVSVLIDGGRWKVCDVDAQE